MHLRLSSQSLSTLTSDGWLLFGTRITRLFAYGSLSVVLVLYLAEVGLSEPQIGLLLILTLLGDTLISLWITTNADRIGRRRIRALAELYGAEMWTADRRLVDRCQQDWVKLIE